MEVIKPNRLDVTLVDGHIKASMNGEMLKYLWTMEKTDNGFALIFREIDVFCEGKRVNWKEETGKVEIEQRRD